MHQGAIAFSKSAITYAPPLSTTFPAYARLLVQLCVNGADHTPDRGCQGPPPGEVSFSLLWLIIEDYEFSHLGYR